MSQELTNVILFTPSGLDMVTVAVCTVVTLLLPACTKYQVCYEQRRDVLTNNLHLSFYFSFTSDFSSFFLTPFSINLYMEHVVERFQNVVYPSKHMLLSIALTIMTNTIFLWQLSKFYIRRFPRIQNEIQLTSLRLFYIYLFISRLECKNEIK